MHASDKYAIWLMPKGDDFKRFQALISDLSLKHDTTLFPPHITLIGGLLPPMDEVKEKARRLVALIEHFNVEFSGIGYLDEYYRCLFLKVRVSAEIMRANLMARKIFERADDNQFMPHLSLIYGDMTTAKKRKIISAIERQVSDGGFKVDSLHLYSTWGEPSVWFEVAKFQLTNDD